MTFVRCASVAWVLTVGTAMPTLAQSSHDSNILASIKTMFDGLQARDTAMMASVIHPDARLVQTFTREGEPQYRSVGMDRFLASIAREGPPIREDYFDPQIVVHDNLATVWVSYTFYVDGQVSHCGEDTFQLARGATGWVIVAIADTQRREGCG